jgi:hypothetical protein
LLLGDLSCDRSHATACCSASLGQLQNALGGGGIFLPVLGVEIMIKEDKKGEIDKKKYWRSEGKWVKRPRSGRKRAK